MSFQWKIACRSFVALLLRMTIVILSVVKNLRIFFIFVRLKTKTYGKSSYQYQFL